MLFLKASFWISLEKLILLDDLGTHLSNTREAKAFALLSEEGIAKGVRRITAVTTGYAFDALKLAKELEQEVDDAAKTEGSALEEVGLLQIWIFELLHICHFWAKTGTIPSKQGSLNYKK